jgi:hypothetical protein
MVTLRKGISGIVPNCGTEFDQAHYVGSFGSRCGERSPLVKIEKGEPLVAIGTYAIVLFVMGLTDRLGDLAGSATDVVCRQLEKEHLPQRISRSRRQKRIVRDERNQVGSLWGLLWVLPVTNGP